MRKQCAQCGGVIDIDDWYKFIRTKYCRTCAADVKRRQNADRMRELRRKTREKNALTKELCRAQAEENERLRELLIIQRQRIRELENQGG